MKRWRHMIGPRARRHHGGLAALYVLGMLVTVGHVALADHHSVLSHDQHHHQHAATTDCGSSPGHHHPDLAPGEPVTGTHGCCHLIHDTLPSQRPRTVQARTPRPSGPTLACPPATARPSTPTTLRRTLADQAAPPPRAGVVTVAAGRAPPLHLHA